MRFPILHKKKIIPENGPPVSTALAGKVLRKNNSKKQLHCLLSTNFKSKHLYKLQNWRNIQNFHQLNCKSSYLIYLLQSWNYNTNRSNMKENPLLYARLSLQLYC